MAFSIWLEAIAIMPQIMVIQKSDGVCENLNSHYSDPPARFSSTAIPSLAPPHSTAGRQRASRVRGADKRCC